MGRKRLKDTIKAKSCDLSKTFHFQLIKH